MAEDLGTLVAKLGSDVSELKRGLSDGKSSLEQFRRESQSVASDVKKALTFVGVAAGLYELANAIKSFITSAASTGARTETLGVAMEQVGKSAGLSSTSLKLLVKDLKDAGITTQEAMQNVTASMAAGLDLSKLEQLATRARDIAVIANKNTSETFQALIHGIISGQTEIFRNLNVPMANMDDVWKRYAASIGKVKEELTQIDKQNATLDELLRVTTKFSGAAAAADGTVSKMTASLARFAEEAKNSLYPALGPAMKAAVEEITKAWKDLESWAKANKQTLQEWGAEAAKTVRTIAEQIRAVVQWAAENRNLLKTIVELFVIVKLTGYIAALSRGLTGLAQTLGIVGAAFVIAAGGVGTFVTAVSMLTGVGSVLAGAYGAYKTFAAPGDVTSGEFGVLGPPPETPAAPAALTPVGEVPKMTQAAVLAAKQEEQSRAKLNQEMKDALAKAHAEAPAPVTKGGGKGGKAQATEDILGETLRLNEIQRQAEIKAAEQSLELFKTTQEKKRAELEKDLAAGLIDGQTYYARLQELNEQETAAALKLLETKRQAEEKAHADRLTEITRQGLSPEMTNTLQQQEAVHHAQELAQINQDAARIKLESEIKVTNELKRQVEAGAQFKRQVEDLEIASAWGPVEEQEAKVRRLYLEWVRAKEEAIKAGASADILAKMDVSYQKQLDIAPVGDQIRNLADDMASGLNSMISSLVNGARDLKSTANNIFQSIFTDAMKPGLDQLKQLLMNGLKQLFGEVGAGAAGAIMGAIGLIGMALTSGGSSSYSSSSINSGITSSQAVRGIIAGDTNLPIAQIDASLKDVMAPHLIELRQISANTAKIGSGSLGGNGQISLIVQGLSESIKAAMDDYFRDYLLTEMK